MGRMKKSEKEFYERIGVICGRLYKKCESIGSREVFKCGCDDEHIIVITFEKVKERD